MVFRKVQLAVLRSWKAATRAGRCTHPLAMSPASNVGCSVGNMLACGTARGADRRLDVDRWKSSHGSVSATNS